MKKRLLFWFLPLVLGAAAACFFVYGFALVFRGNVGTRVLEPQRPVTKAGGPSDKVRILVLGDSIARGTGDERGLGIDGVLVEELEQRKLRHDPAVNLAVNGARTGDLLAQLSRTAVQRFIADSNVIVISIGGNDLNIRGALNEPPDPDKIMNETLEQLRIIVARIREINPKGRVFLVGLYNPFVDGPFGAMSSRYVNRWNGKLMQAFEGDAHLSVVPVADLFSHRNRLSGDRFHPNAEGYRLIGRRIADAL